jgi:hypothetical protein
MRRISSERSASARMSVRAVGPLCLRAEGSWCHSERSTQRAGAREVGGREIASVPAEWVGQQHSQRALRTARARHGVNAVPCPRSPPCPPRCFFGGVDGEGGCAARAPLPGESRFLDSLRSLGMTEWRRRSLGMTEWRRRSLGMTEWRRRSLGITVGGFTRSESRSGVLARHDPGCYRAPHPRGGGGR